MADIKSFPNNQDTYIGAESVMRWLHGRTSGVFAAAGNASVAALATPGMAVTVTDGTGWLSNANADGVVWWNDTQAQTGNLLQLSIDMADATLSRIDRVIVEWQTTNYVALPEIKILKGSLSSSPTAPALTNNSTVRQISLARVSVAAGITAVTASMITDERLNPSVCGLVTDGLSIDTSTINAQFSELLDKLEQEIAGIEAGTEVALKSYVDDAVGTRLPTSGGTMSGNINLGGNALTNVKAPASDTDGATKGYVDGKRKTFTATISTSWSDTRPYTQTVSIAGILATDMPHITPVYSTTTATAILQKEAWLCVSRGDATAGGIQFKCFEEKPGTAIPIQIEVIR